jgi:hypothetical protein
MTTMTMTTPAAKSVQATVAITPASPESVVTLHTTITQDRAGQDVAIIQSARAIELTSGPRPLAWLMPGSLTDAERELLGDELRNYVSREQPATVVLERMIDRGAGEIAHIEAVVIPLSADEHSDVVEFLGDTDQELGRQMADVYADDLRIARARSLPNGRVPMRDLKDYAPHGRA